MCFHRNLLVVVVLVPTEVEIGPTTRFRREAQDCPHNTAPGSYTPPLRRNCFFGHDGGMSEVVCQPNHEQPVLYDARLGLPNSGRREDPIAYDFLSHNIGM